MENAVEVLRSNVEKLPPKDQGFAKSLLSARRPSDKQMFWINKLAERTVTPVEREKVEIGDMTPLVNMFAHYAAHHVKLPRIVLHTEMGLLALHMAGEGSAFPGCIQVKEYEGERRWFGRILKDGHFELSPRFEMGAVSPIVLAMRALAEKPLETAAASGKLTGRCCFCHLRLTDPKSTEMGYGPVCAENFGLDWGSRAFSFAAEPEAVQAPAQPKVVHSRRKVRVG